MVDYDSPETVSTSAKDIERVSVLEKRAHYIEAKEGYLKVSFEGAEPSLATVRSRLISFLDQNAGSLRRSNKKQFKEWQKIILNDDSTFEDIDNIFYQLSDWLDKIFLTKLDTRKVYDTTNIELENEIKGLD